MMALSSSAAVRWCFTALLRCSAAVSDRAVSSTARSPSGPRPSAQSICGVRDPRTTGSSNGRRDLRSNQRAGSETHAQRKQLWSAPTCRRFAGLLLLLAMPCLAGILPNGNFERVDPADSRRPLGWDLPDGLGVQWTQSDHGKAIRLDTQISEIRMDEQWTKMGLTNTWFIPNAASTAIAETYGLSYYSAAIPVKIGQSYRVSFDFKGASGGGKVWVRCFGQQAGETRRLYEKIVFCEKKGTDWVHYQEVFFPTKYRPAVTEMRVMLYAYYPAGVYWFDNVVIEPISVEEYDREKKAAADR